MTAKESGVASPVFACVVPHPPIIVPAVGRGRESEAGATIVAMRTLHDALRDAAPDLLLLICPHGPVARDHFGLLTGPLRGDMRRFGAADVRFERETDRPFVDALLAEARRREIPVQPLDRWNTDDHSAWVPLHYLQDAAPAARVAALTVSFLRPHDHYALGCAIASVVTASAKRVAIIASADGSHVLKADGPYGFNPAGPRWEEQFQRALADWDLDAVLGFEDDLRREAAEDSVPSIAMLMGALSTNDVRPQIVATEAPWGVGYTTALIDVLPRPAGVGDDAPHSAGAGTPEIVRIARAAVEAYVREGRQLEDHAAREPGWRDQRAAAFVSIFDAAGELRGCIGTTAPRKSNLAAEVIHNAIAAASTDPRFSPVIPTELGALRYKVDVLSPPEPVDDESQLDARRYGVVVENGQRRGVLLPDLDGIDTPAQQIEIARRKAAIFDADAVTLYRFEVTRYSEPSPAPAQE